MDSKMLQYSLKLKKLLRKLLEPNFHVRSDAEFNILLSHLAGKDDAELGKKLLGLDLFNEWIVQACSYWEKNVIQPSPNIGRFTMELLSLLSRNEQKFLQLNNLNIHVRLLAIVRARDDCTPSIKLAFVKLLSALLEHKSGFEWIVIKNMWTDVLVFCLTNPTIYIIRDSSSFMYRLIEKAVEYDEQFLNNVIKKIMQPLMINELKSTIDIDEECIKEKLTPTLKLIIFIMEQYCKTECTQKSNDLIPILFLRNYHLEQTVSSYMMIAKNKDFIFELETVTILIYFADLCAEAKEPILHIEQLKNLGMKIFKLLASDISKNYNLNVIKTCNLCNRYWNMIKPRFPVQIDGSPNCPVIFENQITILQMIPICLVSVKFCAITCYEFEFDDFRDNFITKIFKVMCPYTIRVVYSWRNQLMTEENCFDISLKALSYLMQSRQYYSREMGIMAFQAIMYAIKDLVKAVKDNRQLIDTCMKESNYLYMLLDAVGKMIDDFQITWRDCVETICVMSVAIELINLAQWPPKVVAQALKVVNLSIAKYMTPNLALLVDRTYDSAMDMLGPLLTTQLQNEHWEVRDTALEVLCTISEIAHSKFPSFQAVVLQAELPKIVTDMCTSDSQSFVRASALKCLQDMIVVSAFWFQALDNVEVLKKVQYILNEETEAIVRSQAATLVVNIYRHQSFPENMTEPIYELMSYSATIDLHWEVKIKALEFWDAVIQEELKNQGMIDGGFPSVTFSKENRKIVTLTDAEVQRRLNKVLLQLSDCGCLGVLVSAIQDDCDVEVVKQAVDITKKLVTLMEKYNVRSPTCKTYQRTCSTTSVSSPGSSDVISLSGEDMMNNYFNCKDSSVKSNILSPAVSVASFGSRSSSSVKIISPIYFMDFVQQDLDELVNARKKWLNELDSFSSVLDDMLKSYDEIHQNINSMDCY